MQKNQRIQKFDLNFTKWKFYHVICIKLTLAQVFSLVLHVCFTLVDSYWWEWNEHDQISILANFKPLSFRHHILQQFESSQLNARGLKFEVACSFYFPPDVLSREDYC